MIYPLSGVIISMVKLGNPWIFQQAMVDGGEKLVYIPLKKTGLFDMVLTH